jgi:amino acid permease
MKKCSYCGAEYPDNLVACPIDQTPFEGDDQPLVETESKRRPVIDEKRERTQELRRIGLQRLLMGIVIIFAVGVFYFLSVMSSDDDAGLNSHSYSGGSYLRGRGMGMLLLLPVFGLWNIVRGVIYLIRAQSGDEHYATSVEYVMDDLEKRQEEKMGKKVGNGSMFNVLILLVWVFLFLVVVGAIGLGYLWFFPYDKYK